MQTGFRKNHNTKNPLLNMVEKWKHALNKSKHIGAIFLRLSKALITLNHNILITKLNALGFYFNAIKFVRSYFSERFLRVNKNNNFSKWCKTIVRMSFYSKFSLITFSVLFKKLIFATLIHYIRLRIISKKLQLF